MGVHGKIWFLGGVHKKPIYRRELPKKGGLGQFVESKGGLDKKEGVVFLRGGVDKPMHTMDAHFFCFQPEIPFLGKFVPKIRSS